MEQTKTLCEHCQKINPDIVCEACTQCFHSHLCWAEHWCGQLTDRRGRLVKEGTVIQYIGTLRRYTVTEIPETFRHEGLCYANRLGTKLEHHVIIRPRLMEVLIRGVNES